jgi:hypothetical protein
VTDEPSLAKLTFEVANPQQQMTGQETVPSLKTLIMAYHNKGLDDAIEGMKKMNQQTGLNDSYEAIARNTVTSGSRFGPEPVSTPIEPLQIKLQAGSRKTNTGIEPLEDVLPPSRKRSASKSRMIVEEKIAVKQELSLLYQAEAKLKASRMSLEASRLSLTMKPALAKRSLSRTPLTLSPPKTLLHIIKGKPFYHELCKRSSPDHQAIEVIKGVTIRPISNSYIDRNIDYYVRMYQKIEGLTSGNIRSDRGTKGRQCTSPQCRCPIHHASSRSSSTTNTEHRSISQSKAPQTPTA